ncbi:MAG: SEC59/DGK1/VTE5 family protein [Bacteroidetes bacterium]|nr:SEC59/DGK1/VTE5 family protein [Bacteroidota bacterium]
MKRDIDIKYEFYRKLVHIISTVIPVVYYFTSYEFIITLVGTGTVIMILIDVLKRYSQPVGSLYKMVFVRILREDEKDFGKKLFTGGTYYAFGIFLSLLFFSMEVAIASILVMIWCDTLAAIVGKSFGRIRINGSKTLEGSLMFFVTGLVITFILYLLMPAFPSLIYGAIALFITTLIELYIDKLNDNLTIPLVYGFIFTILIKTL